MPAGVVAGSAYIAVPFTSGTEAITLAPSRKSTDPVPFVPLLSDTVALSVATAGPPNRWDGRLVVSTVVDFTRLSVTVRGIVTVVLLGEAASTNVIKPVKAAKTDA